MGGLLMFLSACENKAPLFSSLVGEGICVWILQAAGVHNSCACEGRPKGSLQILCTNQWLSRSLSLWPVASHTSSNKTQRNRLQWQVIRVPLGQTKRSKDAKIWMKKVTNFNRTYTGMWEDFVLIVMITEHMDSMCIWESSYISFIIKRLKVFSRLHPVCWKSLRFIGHERCCKLCKDVPGAAENISCDPPFSSWQKPSPLICAFGW